MYSRLSESATVDYPQLKEALLKRYELTENGFRVRFRDAKPEDGESPEQFMTCLQRYLTRWVELSKVDKSYDGMCDLFLKEQFIRSCPKDLSVYLRERDPETLQDLAKVAEQFLITLDRKLSTPVQPQRGNRNFKNEKSDEKGNGVGSQCYNCGETGHKQADCHEPKKDNKGTPRQCFVCDRVGHLAKDCKAMVKGKDLSKAGAAQSGDPACLDVEACIKDDHLILVNGKKIPIVKSASLAMPGGMNGNMPVVKGKVGEFT